MTRLITTKTDAMLSPASQVSTALGVVRDPPKRSARLDISMANGAPQSVQSGYHTLIRDVDSLEGRILSREAMNDGAHLETFITRRTIEIM
jgi:hypothetical protein